MLLNILWFVLDLFFCTGERLPTQSLRSALTDTLNAYAGAEPRGCYELENKWKCTEPERERMSDDLMESNDMELNYIYLTDSDDASNRSGEGFIL